MSSQVIGPPPKSLLVDRELYLWLSRIYAVLNGQVSSYELSGDVITSTASSNADGAELAKSVQGAELMQLRAQVGEMQKQIDSFALRVMPKPVDPFQALSLLTAPRGTAPSTLSIRSVSAAANLLPTEFMDVDATGGAVTITLPPAAGNAGKMCGVAKNDASANAVTLSGQLNGVASTDLTVQYTALLMVSTGSEWRAW
jgi:hypothetical protein